MAQVELVYTVPDVSCGHCQAAIAEEVSAVPGVALVDVSLDTKRVTVRGQDLDEARVVAAIGAAGYEIAGRAAGEGP